MLQLSGEGLNYELQVCSSENYQITTSTIEQKKAENSVVEIEIIT